MSPRKQPRTEAPPGTLLRPREAASILSVDPKTLAVWCSDGKHGVLSDAVVTLPSGHRRYRERVVRAYRLVLEKGAA
jgi:predicted site-specific integrase-resolvase